MTDDSIISWTVFFDDALFSAMAAIGFSSISHTPRRAYILCAVAAAAGHLLRFLLTMPGGIEMNNIRTNKGITLIAFHSCRDDCRFHCRNHCSVRSEGDKGSGRGMPVSGVTPDDTRSLCLSCVRRVCRLPVES